MAHVPAPSLIVAQVAGGNDAKGPDRGERPGLRAAQLVLVLVDVDALSLRAARQIETGREDVSRIAFVALARIALTQLARIIRAGIETVPHTSPPRRRDVDAKVFVQTFGRPQLPIDMRELPPRVPQKQPAGDRVV